MRKHRARAYDPWSLRQAAEVRLKLGFAPPAKGWPIGWRALSLLHDFACDPNLAPDAVKLLQELQVQQVELDLQREQMESIQAEFSAALARLGELMDFAPVALLRLDLSGMVLEANAACMLILGLPQGEAYGRSLDDFLATEARVAWGALRTRLVDKGARVNACLRLESEGLSRSVSIIAAIGADAASIMLAIHDA